MDDDGIPNGPETRVAIAGRFLERAAKVGISAEIVVIDPLVLSVGADSHTEEVTLRTIEKLRKEFEVNINLGTSNVSFGLPERYTLNEAFMSLAAEVGANCMITDPMKHSLTIRAIDLLMGRDAYGSRYISHYRKLKRE